MNRNKEWSIIQRTKSFPAFFIGLGIILLIIGLYLLFISIDIIINEGASGFFVLGITVAELSISIFLILWKSSLLKPAMIRYNNEEIQLIVNEKLKIEIHWNEKAEITPMFNHALGLNAYYGFSVRSSRLQISASPDEGWSLIELKSAILKILQRALMKKVKISDSFDLINWIDVSKLRTPRPEQGIDEVYLSGNVDR